MVRRAVALTVILATGHLGANVAAAQGERYVGARIDTVRVDVDGQPVINPQTLALIETRPGTPLSMIDLRESLVHLFRLDVYDRIEAHATRAGDGVALVYRLTAALNPRRTIFRGSLGLSARTLRRALEERYGRVPATARVDEAAGHLEGRLGDAGFLNAQVAGAVEAVDGTAAVVFTVEAGPRARIGRVDVRGVPAATQSTWVADLGLAPGEVWDRERFDRRVQKALRRLEGDGHYQAEIRHALSPREAGAIVDVEIQVQPGPTVDLTFEGDDIPGNRESDLVPIARERTADEDLLEDSKRRVEEYLRSQGYADASVTYRRVEEADQLHVVFEVQRGRLYTVSAIDIDGIPEGERAGVLSLLRTEVGQPFVQADLDVDVRAVRALYLQRGHTRATVDATVVPAARSGVAEGPAAIRLTVTPGPQTRVGAIALKGLASMPEGVLRQAMRLKPGEPYWEPALATDRSEVLLAYLNRGYRDAAVDVAVAYTDDRSLADVVYTIEEGLQARIDHVLVVGNTRTSTATILGEAGVQPGSPAGLELTSEVQRRLSSLGLFKRVRADEVTQSGGLTRDLIIRVEEAPVTTIGYGAGLEGGRRLISGETPDAPAVERFEWSPRGFFEIGRRNLWGKNRSIRLFSRVGLRRKDSGGTTGDIGGYGFADYRVLATYLEPRFLEWRTDLQVVGLLEQGVRTSFDFRRRGVSADLSRHLSDTTTLIGRYVYSNTSRFNERYDPADEPLIDRLYPKVRISSFSGIVFRDTRPDKLDPMSGALLSGEAELALQAIGSQVGYAKTLLQGFLYRRVPGADRLVFASGVRVGLATGLGNVPVYDEGGNPVLGPAGEPIEVPVTELPASERFFTGGDTTVRGYALDRLGDLPTLDENGFPLGGNAVAVFNAELRVPVWRALGAVAFVDAGNVFASVEEFDFGKIKPTAGFGLRYKSPIGPIRADLGFKLAPRTFADGSRESRPEFYISLGQAF